MVLSRPLLLVAALVLASTAFTAPAAAVTPPHAGHVVRADALADDVRAFRTDIRATLAEYQARYGSRLSADDRATLAALSDRVSRELGVIGLWTARAERIIRTPASRASKLAAAHAASAAFDRGYASANEALEEVQPILQPKLGLFELIEAKRDFDAAMDRYGELRDRMHALEDSLRAERYRDRTRERRGMGMV